jgi:tetratricopeptide (TPR) repeat protein
MATTRYVIAALLAASSIPAGASIAVIGASSARLCFEAAQALSRPTLRDFIRCDEAVDEPGISRHDLVASYVNRGILRLRRDRLAEAIADFDTALSLDPVQPEASLNKAAALIRQDNARDALPLFTIALEHRTNRPALAHFGRAIAHETLGNAAAAYRDYQMASRLEPDWAEPRTELLRFRVVSR